MARLVVVSSTPTAQVKVVVAKALLPSDMNPNIMPVGYTAAQNIKEL